MRILLLRQEIQRQKEQLRKQVGVRLKHYRSESEMTQDELSKNAGIERTTITSIETGKQSMSLEQLMMFCELFDITPNDMLCL